MVGQRRIEIFRYLDKAGILTESTRAALIDRDHLGFVVVAIGHGATVDIAPSTTNDIRRKVCGRAFSQAGVMDIDTDTNHTITTSRRDHGVAHHFAAPADTVFAAVTDIGALPQWNAIIEAVVETPPALVPGAVWKTRMRKGAMTWVSRAEVVEHDPAGRVFVHRSGTDDGNPSYADWRWSVRPTETGSVLYVSWRLRPATRLRRLVFAPMRSRMLRQEVPGSLEALAAHVTGPG